MNMTKSDAGMTLKRKTKWDAVHKRRMRQSTTRIAYALGASVLAASPAGMARAPLPTMALIKLNVAAPTPWGSSFSTENVNRFVRCAIRIGELESNCLPGVETTLDEGTKALDSRTAHKTRSDTTATTDGALLNRIAVHQISLDSLAMASRKSMILSR